MDNSSSARKGHPAVTLAPGDEVARYVDGKPVFCRVVEVEEDDQVLIVAEAWPAGYSARVRVEDVSLVAHRGAAAAWAG